jgi:hypothetical protein
MVKMSRKKDQNRKKGQIYWLAVFAVMVLIVIASTTIYSISKTPLDEITVYLSPNCGCCKLYVNYLKRERFEVEDIEMKDINTVKSQYGIPPLLQSCHTSVIDGYFVEGHVPVEAIKELIEEKPDVAGIALPGMPSGSPGMPGGKEEPFIIYSLKDGNFRVFMTM